VASNKQKKPKQSSARTGGSRNTASTRGKASAKSAKSAKSQARAERAPLLDEQASTDILGIVLLAVGVALAVAVLTAHTGFLTDYIALGLGYLIGVGRFVLPLIFVIMGITLFVPKLRFVEGRVAAGLICLFVAIIGFFALSVPTDRLFLTQNLAGHGGYVGNAIVWGLGKATGPIIAGIILAAIGIIGLIIAGFSISAIVDRLGLYTAARKEQRAQAAAEKAVVAPRTQRIDPGARSAPAADSFHTAHTALLDRESAQVDLEASDAAEPVTQVLRPDDTQPLTPVGTDAATGAQVAGPRAQEGFELPSFDLLKTSAPAEGGGDGANEAEIKREGDIIVETLGIFGVPAQVHDWIVGPTVTLFKLAIARDVRLNKVTSLADDLALALAAPTLRILAPIPGESFVGIEVPNARRSSVMLGDVLSPAGTDGGPLLLGIGKDITGTSIQRDLAGMPHLLIGGSTGSGKSVAINAMIASIIMRATPSEVRFIMIDPKRVELSLFNGLPHLYVPVVTGPKEASAALAWAVNEMDRRLKVFEKCKVRNIGEYNQLFVSDKAPENYDELPYLVVVIDELADLMMVAAKEVETSIVRIAQLARAAGIHLIVATQRPDANVVTSLIKANITNRIAFRTATAIDSRVVLDQSGAEQLTGLGDMLFSIPAWPSPKRIQGCYVSEAEITEIVDFLKAQGDPEYHEEIFDTAVSGSSEAGAGEHGPDDPLLWDAAETVVAAGFGSTSGIQRRLKVGYSRAGRIMDMLESKGIVGPPDGTKPREVMVDEAGLLLIRQAENELNQEM
jgi:S-DNA-T family DNA segregation ATPase FtsK/SpoIIIE